MRRLCGGKQADRKRMSELIKRCWNEKVIAKRLSWVVLVAKMSEEILPRHMEQHEEVKAREDQEFNRITTLKIDLERAKEDWKSWRTAQTERKKCKKVICVKPVYD